MNKFDRRKIAFILLFASLSSLNTSAMPTGKIDKNLLGVKSGSYSRKPIGNNAKSNSSILAELGPKMITILPLLISALGFVIPNESDSQGTQEFESNNSNTNNSEIEKNKTSENLVNNDDDNNDHDDSNNGNQANMTSENDSQVSQIDINNTNEVDNLPENSENSSVDNNFNKENKENKDLHVNTELDDLKSKLGLLAEQKHYILGIKGKVYVQNPVLETNVNGVSKNLLKQHLMALCLDTGITKGRHSGDDDYPNDWQQSPWEYFFVRSSGRYSDMYEDIDGNSKDLLAKCIEFMYKYKDNSKKWCEYKYMCIEQMASHGGHCEWRAEAITNTVFDILTSFLRESGKIKSNGTMCDVFCELKEKMIANAMNDFLKKHVNHREPLDDANILVSGLKYLFNIPGGDQKNSESYVVRKYLREEMIDSFIKLSHEILAKFESDKRHELMCNDEDTITFQEYLEYTMKTPEQIEKILDKIWTSNTEESNELKEWIKTEGKLSLGYVLEDLRELFKECEKGVVDEKDCSFGVRFLINCVKNDYLWIVNDNSN